MNHLFAHVKSRNSGELFKVISDESVFSPMILTDIDLVVLLNTLQIITLIKILGLL